MSFWFCSSLLNYFYNKMYFPHWTFITQCNLLKRPFFCLKHLYLFLNTPHTPHLIFFFSVAYHHSYSHHGGIWPLKTPFIVRTQREECSFLTCTLCIHLFTDKFFMLIASLPVVLHVQPTRHRHLYRMIIRVWLDSYHYSPAGYCAPTKAEWSGLVWGTDLGLLSLQSQQPADPVACLQGRSRPEQQSSGEQRQAEETQPGCSI